MRQIQVNVNKLKDHYVLCDVLNEEVIDDIGRKALTIVTPDGEKHEIFDDDEALTGVNKNINICKLYKKATEEIENAAVEINLYVGDYMDKADRLAAEIVHQIAVTAAETGAYELNPASKQKVNTFHRIQDRIDTLNEMVEKLKYLENKIGTMIAEEGENDNPKCEWHTFKKAYK